jgi:hypothetical protein
MLVVRVTENVRAVQSSYYSSCPCTTTQVIICKICLELLDLTLGICNVQGRQIQLIINDGIFAVY